ncbi:MAG TPA: hypothetical protein DEP23_16820 [Ruminococcaceae bacterium]|mgnify:CR=1 FL=1|nr:hypothetical protein [Ruminiclostridium sp.]HCA31089.1 hypothetical protein [Oscillospiraceae bacterium]
MGYEFIDHFGRMNFKMFMVTIFNRHTHFHNDFELILPMNGSVEVNMIHESYHLKAGDFFILNTNDMHALTCNGQQNKLLILQVNVNTFKEYFPQISMLRFTKRHFTKTEIPALYSKLKKYFLDMIELIDGKPIGYQLALNGTLNMMFYEIMQELPYKIMNQDEATHESQVYARLSNIIDYVTNNYMKKLTLTDLAKQENLDMSYLSHFIKDNIGITFREYVNTLRLMRAVELLTTTDMSKLDICMECGYSDYRYLESAVKKKYGCSTTQLRKNNKGVNNCMYMEQTEYPMEHHVQGIVENCDAILEFLGRTDVVIVNTI